MTTVSNQRRLREAVLGFERAGSDPARALYALEAERMSRRLGDGAEEARWHQARCQAASRAGRCLECLNAEATRSCGSGAVEGCGAAYCAPCAEALGLCLECGRELRRRRIRGHAGPRWRQDERLLMGGVTWVPSWRCANCGRANIYHDPSTGACPAPGDEEPKVQ